MADKGKKDVRSTIGDQDWKGLQDRANGGNDTFGEQATKHRKIMKEVYRDRERN